MHISLDEKFTNRQRCKNIIYFIAKHIFIQKCRLKKYHYFRFIGRMKSKHCRWERIQRGAKGAFATPLPLKSKRCHVLCASAYSIPKFYTICWMIICIFIWTDVKKQKSSYNWYFVGASGDFASPGPPIRAPSGLSSDLSPHFAPTNSETWIRPWL